MRRIFLAVPVPQEVPEYREVLQAANAEIEGIKWTRLHNLHLTCYFIGNVPIGEVSTVMDMIRPAISSLDPFTLDFENITLAPSRNPRMIWAKYYRYIAFTDLSARIHKALEDMIPQNKFFYKDPIPHITLARFHNIVSRKNEIDIVPVRLPSIRIDGIELWESLPSPEGVKYQPIEKLLF
jgi:2'-5' RNA ligase